MKKNYEAPNFDVITYSLHEAIAGNCSIEMYPSFKNGEEDCMDEDFKGINFGKGENCSIWIDGYCYFTSTTNVVSTS